MKKNRGLGKGLNALINENTIEEKIQLKEDTGIQTGVIDIAINKVEPNTKQPRQEFDDDRIEDLKQSIISYGVIQPLIVKKSGDYFEIIAGERRWRAAKKAGLKEIPVIIKEYSDVETLEISLIENIQREDLNPIEESLAYRRLIKEYGLKQEQISIKVGKSRSAIANSLRLLQLDERVQEFLVQGVISTGHARALLGIDDHDLQYEIALKIIDLELNVRDTEKAIKNIKSQKTEENKEDKKEDQLAPIYREVEDRIKEILGTKVQIVRGKRKGKIEIEYYNDDDLDRLLDLFKSIQEGR